MQASSGRTIDRFVVAVGGGVATFAPSTTLTTRLTSCRKTCRQSSRSASLNSWRNSETTRSPLLSTRRHAMKS